MSGVCRAKIVAVPRSRDMTPESPSAIADLAAVELLGDGQVIQIRPLQPDDQAGLVAALSRVSDESMRRRFFALRRSFSDKEVAFFTNVDFVDHVALVAIADPEGRREIAGGSRYIVVRPGTAEFALCIVDSYQGQGIGSALVGRMIAHARHAGLRELVADILPENRAMVRICETAGPRMTSRREHGVLHVTLEL
jgi:RimJ/RimL family protein N-acetyltransferase